MSVGFELERPAGDQLNGSVIWLTITRRKTNVKLVTDINTYQLVTFQNTQVTGQVSGWRQGTRQLNVNRIQGGVNLLLVPTGGMRHH